MKKIIPVLWFLTIVMMAVSSFFPVYTGSFGGYTLLFLWTVLIAAGISVTVRNGHFRLRRAICHFQLSAVCLLTGAFFSTFCSIGLIGKICTYAGFAWFMSVFILSLCKKDGAFRTLWRKLMLFALLLTFVAGCTPEGEVLSRKGMSAESRPVEAVKKIPDEATVVRYRGRLMPLRSLCDEWMRQLYGRPVFRGYTGVEAAFGWLYEPERWMCQPMVRIPDPAARKLLNCGKYAAPADFFDADGNYKLARRGFTQTDRRIELLQWMRSGAILQTFYTLPVSQKEQNRLHAELIYDRLLSHHFVWLLCFILAIPVVVFTFFFKKQRFSLTVLRILTLGVLIFQVGMWLLRWYVSQHIPLINGYETLQFLSMILLLTVIVLWNKNRIFPVIGLILSGFFLWVATLSFNSVSVTALPAALDSPWLSLHVSVIMLAYALLAFTFGLGVTALLMGGRRRNNMLKISDISRLLLYPAIFFLSLGIITGAMWADSAWGSYWSWDPKEVWALVTWMLYLPAVQPEIFKFLEKPVIYNIYLVAAFAGVLMTYFGVTTGMHGYG